METKQQTLKGIFCIILSGLGFALMALFVKEAGKLPIIEKAVFRNLIAGIITCIPLWKHRHQLTLPSSIPSWTALITRSLVGTLGLILNFYAITTINIADASIIQKLSPFVLLIFSYFIFKEKLSLLQTMALCISFIGVLFVIKPSTSHFISQGAAAALGAALSIGIAHTCIRYLGLQKISGEFIIFFFSLSSIILLTPFVFWNWVPLSGQQFIFLLLAGGAAALGQFGITYAYRYAPAKNIAVFDYSQVLFAGLLGVLFLGEIPDVFSLLGYTMIISIGIVLIRFSKNPTP